MSISAYKFVSAHADAPYEGTFYFHPSAVNLTKAISGTVYVLLNRKMTGINYYWSGIGDYQTATEFTSKSSHIYGTTAFQSSARSDTSINALGVELFGYYAGAPKYYDISRETLYTRSSTAATGGTVAQSTAAGYNVLSASYYATPTASAGYWFKEWRYTSDGSAVSAVSGITINSGTNRVTVTRAYAADFVVYAHFVPNNVYLYAAVAPSSSGTIAAYVDGTFQTVSTGVPVSTVGSQKTITLVAAPSYNYTLATWTVGGTVVSTEASYSFTMPYANLTVQANFTVKPSYAIGVTKENGTYGTVALTSATAPSVAETSGAISATGYTNVSYTLTATVTNPALNMFSGWYSGATLVSPELAYTFTQSSATALTLVAKFAQLPSYTLGLYVSDGGTNVVSNDAITAGCSIVQDRPSDFTSPDRWLAKSITITATTATGWRVAGWGVSNVDNTGGNFQDLTGANPLTFTLSFNSKVICAFELVPVTAACSVDAPSASAGSAEVSFGLETGELLHMRYGESAIFTAAAESGYAFAGWFDADDSLVSATTPYIHAMTGDLTLVAKFSATVTLTAAHSVAADDTGTVQLNGGTAGATATASVILGATCVIKAIETAGSIFDSWFLTSDTGFASPLQNYLSEYTITVTDATSLTVRFLGTADLEDRYLCIKNYNNNTSAYDSLLGILSASGGTEIDKAGAGGWDAFFYDPPPGGLTIEPELPGDRYYKFTGSKYSLITAVSNASLGFMQWKSSYLIPHTADIGNGYTNFAESSPVVIGTSPSISIVTNRHYVITAVWGDPVSVDVSVRYAAGSDSTNGGFTMTPVTANRVTIQSGFSDKHLQGTTIVLAAEVENGYELSGWYYDSAGTKLASSDTTFTHTVIAPVEFFAKFKQDSDAIYSWQGGTANKMAEWRSKRFVSSKPFNPSSASVYADSYPVTLNIYTASSPNSPSQTVPSVSVYARNQNGFRLPMARPEKYFEIEVLTPYVLTQAAISTSMEGLSQ